MPIIIGFVADLMFTTRIENAARHLGYQMKWLANANVLEPVVADPTPEKPGELLHGRSGQLFDFITQQQPALIIFDLNNTAVPWSQWISRLKSSPATRRIPILGFGSHVDVDMMKKAKKAGADAVLARSRFTADMLTLLQKYARLPDHEGLASACLEPLHPLARQGITLFNQGEYYRCHDELEEAWRKDAGPARDLYQAILQVGIALYQVQRGNYRGAVKMLLRVRQWLAPLPDICREVDVAALRQNGLAIYDSLVALGPDKIDNFEWQLVQPIRFK